MDAKEWKQRCMEELLCALPFVPKPLCEIVKFYVPLPVSIYSSQLITLFSDLPTEMSWVDGLTHGLDYAYMQVQIDPKQEKIVLPSSGSCGRIELETGCGEAEDRCRLLHLLPLLVTSEHWIKAWIQVTTDSNNYIIHPPKQQT